MIGRGDGHRRGPAIGEMPGLGKNSGEDGSWDWGGRNQDNLRVETGGGIMAGVDGKGMGRRKGGGWA